VANLKGGEDVGEGEGEEIEYEAEADARVDMIQKK
jgi:hypothetical protein